MATISEREFERIVDGIAVDADIICRHNPIGTRAETLLWMLTGCMVSYLGLSDQETPCFPGKPAAETYREAVRFMLAGRMETPFDADPYLARLENV